MCDRKRTSAGFALTDLIVVIALSAITASILLPVIQEMREAARLTVCEDRLAQIGMDSQFFHDVHNRLPMAIGASGTVEWTDWTSSASAVYWGWQQNTSPIALAASVSTEFDIDPLAFDFTTDLRNAGTFGSSIYFYTLDGWVDLVSQPQPRYRCPALSRLNGATPSVGTTIGNQPVTVDGETAEIGYVFDSADVFYGRTNYVGCVGADGGYTEEFNEFWQYRGMITSRQLVTQDDVSMADGLANTIMFGENIGEIVTEARRTTLQLSHCWFNGGIARGRGRAEWLMPGTPDKPLLGNALNSAVDGFGSFHRDGVNFLFGDGSVHRIPRDVDLIVYYAFCGAFDTQ